VRDNEALTAVVDAKIPSVVSLCHRGPALSSGPSNKTLFLPEQAGKDVRLEITEGTLIESLDTSSAGRIVFFDVLDRLRNNVPLLTVATIQLDNLTIPPLVLPQDITNATINLQDIHRYAVVLKDYHTPLASGTLFNRGMTILLASILASRSLGDQPLNSSPSWDFETTAINIIVKGMGCSLKAWPVVIALTVLSLYCVWSWPFDMYSFERCELKLLAFRGWDYCYCASVELYSSKKTRLCDCRARYFDVFGDDVTQLENEGTGELEMVLSGSDLGGAGSSRHRIIRKNAWY
jgi:hypothetical protein